MITSTACVHHNPGSPGQHNEQRKWNKCNDYEGTKLTLSIHYVSSYISPYKLLKLESSKD